MQDYTLDLEKAEELLIRDGWTYDETGKAYAAGEGKLRHKLFGEGYKPLDGLWIQQGYTRHPELQSTFVWKEIGEAEESPKTLTFWLKEDPAP